MFLGGSRMVKPPQKVMLLEEFGRETDGDWQTVLVGSYEIYQ